MVQRSCMAGPLHAARTLATSTNHLCGPGYWAWLIPLGSGAHSVGIVCDAKMHPLENDEHVRSFASTGSPNTSLPSRGNAQCGATR